MARCRRDLLSVRLARVAHAWRLIVTMWSNAADKKSSAYCDGGTVGSCCYLLQHFTRCHVGATAVLSLRERAHAHAHTLR